MVDLLGLEEIVLQEEPRLYLYRGKQYRSVTDYIRAAGFGPDFSMVPEDRMERACRRGEMVHLACAYFDNKELKLDSVDSRIRGYVDAYLKFDRECPGKIVATEKRLVCPEMGLATTPDSVKFVCGRRSVVERKTSQSGASKPAARLQTAGQKKIWNALFPNTPVYDRYGLELRPNGVYRLVPHEDPEDELAFDDLVAYARAKERRDRWMQKYGQRR